VAFQTNWASPRDGAGTCWLDLPSLYDDGAVSGLANSFLGHSLWASETRGQPLTGGGAFVNYEQAASVKVDTAASVPVPSSIDPPSWSCAKLGPGGACQAYVALQQPGASDQRLRALIIWSLAGGLLLALLGESLLGLVRDLFVEGRDGPRAKGL
jgi:hypothetical protein